MGEYVVKARPLNNTSNTSIPEYGRSNRDSSHIINESSPTFVSKDNIKISNQPGKNNNIKRGNNKQSKVYYELKSPGVNTEQKPEEEESTVVRNDDVSVVKSDNNNISVDEGILYASMIGFEGAKSSNEEDDGWMDTRTNKQDEVKEIVVEDDEEKDRVKEKEVKKKKNKSKKTKEIQKSEIVGDDRVNSVTQKDDGEVEKLKEKSVEEAEVIDESSRGQKTIERDKGIEVPVIDVQLLSNEVCITDNDMKDNPLSIYHSNGIVNTQEKPSEEENKEDNVGLLTEDIVNEYMDQQEPEDDGFNIVFSNPILDEIRKDHEKEQTKSKVKKSKKKHQE